MFDWQTLAVFLIVLTAFAYAARRGLARLRSFRPKSKQAASLCATGCGACGEKQDAAPSTPTIVQITPSKSLLRRGHAKQ